jgi:hypothetical protein
VTRVTRAGLWGHRAIRGLKVIRVMRGLKVIRGLKAARVTRVTQADLRGREGHRVR